MLSIEESDLQDIESFSLRWRWTDATWNLLPDDDLACIRPLTTRKAAELDEQLRELVNPVCLRIVSETYSSLRSIAAKPNYATFDTSGDASSTENWLRTVLPSHDGGVFVSWDNATAATVRLAVFIKYWDDFCYPLSDDVVVVPPSAEWVLYYFHEETFFFWNR